tara:strand:+ start:184 stop:423 length:240 start_codon:yes stop_codon:yes gene_type:complete
MGSQDKAFMKKVIATLISVITLLGSIVGGFGLDLKRSVDELRETGVECMTDRARMSERITSLERYIDFTEGKSRTAKNK